jgi:F420-dependent oxidoreductase-like protein
MKISFQLVWFNWEERDQFGSILTNLARAIDQSGFDSLWIIDHYFQMEGAGRAEDPLLESYTVLSYVAALTQNIGLGTLVTGVSYRHPGALIKTVTSLDVLSGGRAWLGIGAGWYEREARGLGLPFPPLAERFERLEETLAIARQMWAGDTSPFNGKHYQLAEPINQPQPLSQPHPSILIGGEGERKTLRLVAQYADACNFDGGIGPDGVRHKLNVLRVHCDAVERDYDGIDKTLVTGVAGRSEQQLVDYCGTMADAGIQHIIFNDPQDYTLAPIETLARIIPTVRDL